MPPVLCCISGAPSLPSRKVVLLVLCGVLIGLPIGAVLVHLFSTDREPTTENSVNSTACVPAPLEDVESGSGMHASEFTANETIENEEAEADSWENENATEPEQEPTEKPPETSKISPFFLPTSSPRLRKLEPSPPEGYHIPTIFHGMHPCRKSEFFVAPSAIGLTHIFAPQRLDLGYCTGVCIFPMMSDRFNHTVHRYLIDQFRLHEQAPYLPKSCCVPVAYKDTSVIMEDGDGGYVKRLLKGASVSHCGCR